jgi:hypothetical protein
MNATTRDIITRALAVIETSDEADEHAELRAELRGVLQADDDDPYPGQILCPDEKCEGIADMIGDDTRGRAYYNCAECGHEWIFGPDAPELARLPEAE